MSQRDVCLPLESFDKCARCGSQSDLRLCSKCGEIIYCSQKCQKEDWKNHKLTCEKVDRVELKFMYPFLATLAEIAHCRQWKPFHPALTHQIVIPRPQLPILLREEIPEDEITLEKWWPGSRTDSARRKLFQRISHEGYTLPILMAISLALLAGIYTAEKVRRGIRLQYQGSPISDFGIAKGSVDVQANNRLAYFKDTPFHQVLFHGQDPNDHYWLYFKTLKDAEVIIDFGMGVFNAGLQVRIDPYIPGAFPTDSFAPAFFQESRISNNGTGAHTERERFSVLRNEDLHGIASHLTRYRATLQAETVNTKMWKFMDTIAGEEECEAMDRMITMDLLQYSLVQFESLLDERAWLQEWPKSPECRPCSDEVESSQWWQELMEWKRRNKFYVPQDPISFISRLDDMILIMYFIQGLEISH